jgi:N-methylhydantoinase A
MYEATVVGFPVQTPWVDVRSIGAGGGSIAYLEAGRSLRVGPRSAGADPGPACYGRGGAEPTVTDAALVLGMLGRGVLAGGLEMSRPAALAALERLAAALELDVDRVAQGIVRIASAAMANAIREITVERGEDPRRAALLAFGGAGPLFATLLASELGVREIVIPPFAGNFSAWGMLGADVTRTSALTRILPLDADGMREVDAVSRQLLDELREPGDDAETEVAVDARFVGQEHTLTIGWPEDATPEGVRRIFLEEYRRTFGQALEGRVELVTVRVTLRRALARREIEPRPAERKPAQGAASVPAHSFHRGTQLDFALIDRDQLGVGERFAGPAIVVEATSTTYVDASFRGTVHGTGALILSRDEED